MRKVELGDPGEVLTLAGSGDGGRRPGRRLWGRLWQPAEVRDVLLVLHGVMSHSGWFGLWGPELASRGVALLAPDRRGSGLDPEARGDAESAVVLLDDLDRWLELAGSLGGRVHLGGFCWGSNVAVCHIAARRPEVASLVLIAPGVFPAAKVLAIPQEEGESAEATVEVPLAPEDFTHGPLLESYLRPDPLRLERISPRFVALERQIAPLLPVQLARSRLPTLVVAAERDVVSDNAKMRQLFDRHLASRGRYAELPTAHGVVFEAPEELASECAAWVRGLASQVGVDS